MIDAIVNCQIKKTEFSAVKRNKLKDFISYARSECKETQKSVLGGIKVMFYGP
jgi:hypothetical protein